MFRSLFVNQESKDTIQNLGPPPGNYKIIEEKKRQARLDEARLIAEKNLRGHIATKQKLREQRSAKRLAVELLRAYDVLSKQ